MIELSQKTMDHIRKLFAPTDHAVAAGLLRDECGDHLPLVRNPSPESLERIRFSALKVSGGNLDRLREAILLAQRDWRDLLVAAGFGRDIHAHTRWMP